MADKATKTLDQMRRAETNSVKASDDNYEQEIARLRAQAIKEDKPFSRVTATERQTFFHPSQTEGMSPAELREIGAAQDQLTTLKPMDTTRTTAGQPPNLINVAGVPWTQDALNAKAQAWFGRDFQWLYRSGELDKFKQMLRKDPDRRKKIKDDFSYYQDIAAKIYPDIEDQRDVASGDLNLRLNQPEEYGTIESSHEDNWDDSGLVIHTLPSADGLVRKYAADLETGDTWNVTGHPKFAEPEQDSELPEGMSRLESTEEYREPIEYDSTALREQLTPFHRYNYATKNR